jgi:ferritin-like protein
MAQSSGSLHEPSDRLRPETIDLHRAVVSLMEELEAVDWYNQRVDATGDRELAQILRHNRDEEKEHASMVLEWIRRHDPAFDGHLRTYLFTDRPVLEEEADANGASPQQAGGPTGASLPIGALRDKEVL